jgi:hypothetical protein
VVAAIKPPIAPHGSGFGWRCQSHHDRAQHNSNGWSTMSGKKDVSNILKISAAHSSGRGEKRHQRAQDQQTHH